MPTNPKKRQIDAEHPEYAARKAQWHTCRLAIAGEDAIRAEGETLLPRLPKQDDDEYRAYQRMASFYEATGRTHQAIVGALTSREPQLTAPGDPDDEATDAYFRARLRNEPVNAFIRNLISEVVATGRVGLLVEAPPEELGGGEPYITSYRAEDIVNWQTFGDGGFSKVVLRRARFLPSGEDLDGLVLEEQTTYAVLDFGVPTDSLGVEIEGEVVPTYRQRHFIADERDPTGWRQLGPSVHPEFPGGEFGSIPFYILSPGGSAVTPAKPPMLPMANLNISHYLSAASLSHGRWLTGLPTAWVTGHAMKEGESIALGSADVLVFSEKDTQLGMLEFSGQGLSTLENGLAEYESRMAIIGVRMLEAPKLASESAENQRVKRSGEAHVLASISDSASETLTQVARFASRWAGEQGSEDIRVIVEKEFMPNSPDAGVMAQRVAMLQQGLMDWDSFVVAGQRDGTFSPDESPQVIAERIADGPFGLAAAPATPEDIDGEPQGEQGLAHGAHER